MNKLKQFLEELGSLNKQRRSKVQQLEGLVAKEDFSDEDQTKYDDLKSEIADIDEKRERKQTAIDTLREQEEIESSNGENSDAYFPGGGDEPDSEEQEISNYRLTKAIAEASDPNHRLSGLELEMHQEAKSEAKEGGYQSQLQGNLHIPQKVLHARMENSSIISNRQIRNDLSVTGGTDGNQGGVTVDTELLSLIDILRAKLVFVDSAMNSRDGLGATFLTELEGDVAFPKAEEDTNDPAVKSETGEADEQNPTFGQVDLSPNRLPAVGEVTRQLMLQSSIAVENWFRNYLMYKLSKSMNKDIITYLLNLAGTNAITIGTDGGPLDWDTIVAFETEVEDAGESDMEPRLGYLTNPRVKGKLKTTEKASNTGQFIWQDGEVNNYSAQISQLIPKNLTKGTGTDLSAAIFADWPQLLIGQWGGLDFLINPYSKDSQGIIRINTWTFFDKAVRHASKFSICKEIVTS